MPTPTLFCDTATLFFNYTQFFIVISLYTFVLVGLQMQFFMCPYYLTHRIYLVSRKAHFYFRNIIIFLMIKI